MIRLPARTVAAESPACSQLLATSWRLGLGWLTGRRFLLVSSTGRDGAVRRSIAPFAYAAGNHYVVAPSDAPWASATAPLLVQSHVGPLAVRSRTLEPGEEPAVRGLFAERAPDLAATDPAAWRVLEPTGDRAPEMVAPDLIWLWPLAPIAVVAGRRLLRRRR